MAFQILIEKIKNGFVVLKMVHGKCVEKTAHENLDRAIKETQTAFLELKKQQKEQERKPKSQRIELG